ncbi:MAG: hypothetical protein ABIH52_00675 [Candidatus Aenigmatarchaeota archaeon]|nr:hypothetical protein [Nanoarchaeota archaeon]
MDTASTKTREESGYLFRGAPISLLFDRYAETEGRYYGTNPDDPVTSTSEHPAYAMVYGRKSRGVREAQGDPFADPVLLAIKASGYPTMQGLEGKETEILGEIDYRDIQIIRDVETLRKITGVQNPGMESYFQAHFARPLPEFSEEELLVV